MKFTVAQRKMLRELTNTPEGLRYVGAKLNTAHSLHKHGLVYFEANDDGTFQTHIVKQGLIRALMATLATQEENK